MFGLAFAIGLELSTTSQVDDIHGILRMTEQNWVAVRAHDGHDLLYYTHLEVWRCGIDAAFVGVNGAAAQTPLALSACTGAGPQPVTSPPYLALPEGSVRSVTVRLVYAGGAEDRVTFRRAAIELP